MNTERWRTLLRVEQEVLELVSSDEWRVESELESIAHRVFSLHTDVQSRLEPLLGGGGESSELLPFIVYLDECIRGRISHAARLLWPALQENWIGSMNGGVAFFERLRALLARSEDVSGELSLYYYCLQRGFVGKYRDDAASLARVREQVETRLRQLEAHRAPSENVVTVNGSTASATGVSALWFQFAAVVAAIVLLGTILILSSWSGAS